MKDKTPLTTSIRKRRWFNLFDLLHSRASAPAVALVSSVLLLILIYPAWHGSVLVLKLKLSIEQLNHPKANAQSTLSCRSAVTKLDRNS